MARAVHKLDQQFMTAFSSSSIPIMLRYVSCWPAKERSGRSSAVADERTATGISLNSAYAARIADATSAGMTPRENAARICADALSSALAFSAERLSTADSIVGSQRLASTKAR